MKYKFDGKILQSESDLNGRYIILTVKLNDHILVLINIYGYNSHTKNDFLFGTLEDKISLCQTKYPNSKLILGGDFNVTQDDTLDRWPPKRSPNINNTFVLFTEKFDIIDIWRKKFPIDKMFTWSNKACSQQSRIDYWLVSRSINENSIKVEILPTPLTDHKTIYIHLDFSTTQITKNIKASYWKLNISLLENEKVKKDISNLIDLYWNKALHENIFGKNWELLKFEIRKFVMKLGGKQAKMRQKEEEEVIAKIIALSKETSEHDSDEERLKMNELQNKLDALYKVRAKGAFIRSRQKWLEEGETNSSYFFRMEKHHFQSNSITQLVVDGSITNNPKKIAAHCANFYQNLYKSNVCEDSTRDFFKLIGNVKTINADEKSFCDGPILIQEIVDSIANLKNNKSPGNDGITAEFYKMFVKQVSLFLYKVYLESINVESLPQTLNQGLITLIPKPKKDLLLLDNWRPISLLNNDYKILALIFAKRIKITLNTIIDETQSGFMKNRHITNNIRLVLDILDYSDLVLEESFILFLDFYKAFDTVEHLFIVNALEKFGFGVFFIKVIKTLYKNNNSSIKLGHGTSQRFTIQRGIRQGCPISPYLFLLAMQLLAVHIINSGLQGISIAEKQIIISQLADDTTLFLKNKSQIPIAINIINSFSKASGLYLNIKKCELLPIKNCTDSFISEIPIKNEINYLGIIINKDKNTRCSLNFNPLIEKTQHKLNQWLQRDLSLKGRILLTKAEGISRLTYAALSLDVSKDISNMVDRILFNFIWKNKTHYIRKSVIMNNYESGGLNFLDFSTLNNTFKINWIKQFIKNPSSTWNFIPAYIFNNLGGLNFLLMCNYNIGKIPIKLSNFHKQMLLSWSLIYKHNFSPHKYFIWNNKDICYKHKSLFFPNWFNNGIILVTQLFKCNGNLLNYTEFLSTFKLPITTKEFAIIFDALPRGVITLLKNDLKVLSCPLPSIDPCETFIGKYCLIDHSKNNKRIRSLFQNDLVSIPYVISYWDGFIEGIDWKKVWILSNKYLLTNKVKEVSYKIIHKCYPVKNNLKKLKHGIDLSCSFCKDSTETMLHLFWNCRYSRFFWKDLITFTNNNIKKEKNLKIHIGNVLFGFTNYKTSENNEYYIINLLILMAKFHIHKCKFSNQKPFFFLFVKEMEQYIKVIKMSNNKKALKTLNVCNLFNIFL